MVVKLDYNFNMKKSFFDRRIPTLFALFLLVGGLTVTLFLLNQTTFVTTFANPALEPKNVTVTNISDTSVTIAFTTQEKSVAAISSPTLGAENLLFDNRDATEKKAYYSHQITIPNLSENSEVTYKILSGGKTYPEDESEFFTARTSSKIFGIPSSSSMKGVVILPDSTPASDTLILVTPEKGSVISAITNDKGEYEIPALLLKNLSATSYLNIEDSILLSIQALFKELQSDVSMVFIPNGTVPLISLSQNYQFIAETNEEFTATPSSLFTEPDAQISNKVQILSPSKDQSFIDAQPQLRGTAVPNAIVKIYIDGNKNTAQVRSSPNGNWSYRPSIPLAVGEHIVAIESVNLAGVVQRVTQSFSIFASGTQIAQSATPSATLTITPTSGPTTSPTTTLTPTTEISPSITIGPTTSPTPTTISVTSIPIGAPTEAVVSTTPNPTSFVPTKIPLPPTGITEQSIALTALGILFIVAGSVLFFVL